MKFNVCSITSFKRLFIVLCGFQFNSIQFNLFPQTDKTNKNYTIIQSIYTEVYKM